MTYEDAVAVFQALGRLVEHDETGAVITTDGEERIYSRAQVTAGAQALVHSNPTLVTPVIEERCEICLEVLDADGTCSWCRLQEQIARENEALQEEMTVPGVVCYRCGHEFMPADYPECGQDEHGWYCWADCSTCDTCRQLIGADGCPVEHEINDRIIGLDLEQIRGIPRVIGVAGGAAKVEVIRAALRGRLLDVLVTDELTARQLLPE